MMRYRLLSLAVMLAGFLAINYFFNETGQKLIMGQIDTPETAGIGLSIDDARLEAELKTLNQMKALVDTLEAHGINTESARNLRNANRAQIENIERLRISYFLSQSLWRQTVVNIIWAILATVILLPVGLVLDLRYPGSSPVKRNIADEDPERGDDKGTSFDE